MSSRSTPPRDSASRVRLGALAAHVLGASVGLAGALAYDTRFWLSVRGNELTISGAKFQAALAIAYGLAWPVALVLGVALYALERVTMRRGIPALVRPTAWLSRAPDEIADAFSFAVGLVASAGAMLFVVTTLQSNLHSERVIAILIACTAPFVVGAFETLRRRLAIPIRRFARGLDGAACPLLFHGLAFASALAVRMRFAELDPALDHSVPWNVVWALAVGGAVHALVAFSLPRAGVSARRVRALGAGLVVVLAAGTAFSVLRYDRTSSQRAFVEDISWVGTRAHRLWSELLDRDGDGHPALLAGGDCNDRRADVHPGAFDRPGDGIDADCFGGDGTPRFDDRAMFSLTPRSTNDRPLNIVMISIDAMRPDRLRAAGERRNVTPRLDRLLAESTWFRDVTSASPRTTRSVPAIFTGQYPGSLEYERSLGRVDLAGSAVTLAELVGLRMDTVAILGTSYFREQPGILQGFANVQHGQGIKPPPEWATDLVLQQLDRMREAPRPTFLWVHYFGAHEPYLGDRFPSRFGPGPAAAYDTDLWRVDREVGRILDGITSRGLAQNTAVIVFSDHGESLGEHGGWGHSTLLTEEQVRSVLMFRVPRAEPRVVETPVALFDIFPTVLDLANVPSAAAMPARNLAPAFQGNPRAIPHRALFSEVLPDAIYAIETQSIRVGNRKLIYWPRTQRAAYYDLGRDPHELHDLADTHRRAMRPLLATLLEWNVASHLDANRTAAIIHEAVTRRLPPDVPALSATFVNGISLVGAHIGTHDPSRDTVVPVDLYFRADRPIPSEYYVHLTFDPADAVSNAAGFAAHHSPLDGMLPTTMWRPGDIVRDRVYVRIPATAQPNVPLIAHVELWSHFHVRMPVTATWSGRTVDTVDVGTMVVH